MSKALWEKYSKEELELFVKESKSFRSLAEKIGYNVQKSKNYSINSLKRMIEKYNFDISHFKGQGWNKDNFDYSRFKNNNAIKSSTALLAITQLRGWKCEQCNLKEWNGQQIPLEIHHLDGNKLNNDLNNLQLLCPNCHALTENWRGKNICKKNRDVISEEDFVKALNEAPSIRQALISLGLTPKGGNYDRAYTLIGKYNIEKFKLKGEVN